MDNAVYTALKPYGRCFVRLCDTDDALWVTDLPRRLADASPAQRALEQIGCVCRMEKGLWYIDWTQAQWEAELQALPRQIPPWPPDAALHPVYALCRLWLAHPAPLAAQPMQALRAVRKLTWQQPPALLKKIPALHQAASLTLRQGRPMAYGAGQMLAQWIAQQEEKA